MNQHNNVEFYLRREQQARELAENAHQAEVRMIHLKMASDYAAKAAMTVPAERTRLSIVHG